MEPFIAQLGTAFGMLADVQLLFVVLLASVFGLFVGAIPGLTATMATALLVPVTFFMTPLAAVAAIVSCTAMAITAGDIPGCLIRMPGTPASAAYTDETYAMTKRGLAAQRKLSTGWPTPFPATSTNISNERSYKNVLVAGVRFELTTFGL